MPSDDPIESASKGATKAALEWGSDRIKELARKFSQRELSFIEDQETIDQVITQRKKPEFLFYLKYVKNRDLRLQIEMGLLLKKLEKEDPSKIQNLRNKIYRKYKSDGLHVAELAQCGVFSRYVGLLLEKTMDEIELAEGIEGILHNIEKYVLFVQADSDIRRTAKTVVDRITVNLPRAIIIFSKGNAAKQKADKIIQIAKKETQSLGYRIENQVDEESNQKYHFILKISVEFFQNKI